MYSWKPIQREAAKYLLQYRTSQQELIDTLKAMQEAGLNTIPLTEEDEHHKPQELPGIDPFTFLATFNRPLTSENLKDNWRFLKTRWNLQAPIPDDFVGAPTLNPLNSWFFGWKADRKATDLENLWELAAQVLEQGWQAVTPKLFADCLEIHSVALSKLTTGLYWIAPDDCLAMNATTNAYLAEHGLQVDVKTKEAYNEVMAAVRAKFQKPLPEICHEAYLAKQAEAGGKITPETLAKLWCDFRGLFPEFKSFAEPGEAFTNQELKGKRKGLHDLLEKGGNPNLRSMVESGQAQAALKLLIKAAGAQIASFHSWKKSLGDGDEQKVAAMLTAFLKVAESQYEGPHSLAPIFVTSKAQQLTPSWDTLSALLWAMNPETFFPIKISYYRKFAEQAGLTLPASSPSAEAFDRVLKFGQRVREALEPAAPQDWVDIQSFIFQLGYFYMNRKEDADNPLAVPFDKLFSSLEEADQAFELIRKCMTRLGLTAASAENPMVALTLRLDQASPALRFNYGNWAICAWIKAKQQPAAFEFICPADLLPPSGKNTGGQFSDQVDGKSLCLISVPVSAVSTISEQLEQSLGLVQKRFEGWSASPYRGSHSPGVFQMVFDPELRSTYLLQGLPAASTPPEAELSEPDATTEPEGFEPYSIEAALQEVFIPEADLQGILQTLKRKQNIVLQGPPGVGKTFVAKRLAYILMGCKDESRVAMVQFHQSYSYEDFVQGYRPDGCGGFTIKPGLLYEFAKKAQANPEQPYFLVIDELNRGNVSKIFGELMLLVETDKRGEEFAIPLTYSKNIDDKFYLPKNLHLIATMNTADRSLAVVDYALRRRFAFLSLEPAFRNRTFLLHLANSGLSAGLVETICERIGHLNELIEEDQTNLGKGYKIGHSFFVPQAPVKDEAAWYKDIVNHELLPLLAEYWLDDENRLTEVSELLRQ